MIALQNSLTPTECVHTKATEAGCSPERWRHKSVALTQRKELSLGFLSLRQALYPTGCSFWPSSLYLELKV